MKQVWYVSGDPERTGYSCPSLFDTKEAAEKYARIVFPDEDESKRYARIYYRDILTMSDLSGG